MRPAVRVGTRAGRRRSILGSPPGATLPTLLSSTLTAATEQSPISREDMWAWTGAPSYGSYSNFTATSVVSTDGPGGATTKVLNQHFPAVVSGSTSNYGAPPTGTGITLTSAPLAGGNVDDEATIEYDFRAKSSGVPWGWGGKLPGLGGLRAGASGGVPTGGQPSLNGWSARLMFRRQGSDTTNLAARLVGYVYDPTQQAGSIGQDRGTGKLLNRGQWYHLKQYHKMNSINVEGSSGNADGIHRIWVDGVLVYENLAQVYRVHSSYGINYLCWDNFYGGNDAADGAPWGPTADTDLQFDNLLITGGTTPTPTGGGTTTWVDEGAVPLGPGDTFRGGPIDCRNATGVDVAVSSDQPFTVRLDTSPSGSTFTDGATSYAAVAAGDSYTVTRTVPVTAAWARLSITCGTTGMTRLSATTSAHA